MEDHGFSYFNIDPKDPNRGHSYQHQQHVLHQRQLIQQQQQQHIDHLQQVQQQNNRHRVHPQRTPNAYQGRSEVVRDVMFGPPITELHRHRTDDVAAHPQQQPTEAAKPVKRASLYVKRDPKQHRRPDVSTLDVVPSDYRRYRSNETLTDSNMSIPSDSSRSFINVGYEDTEDNPNFLEPSESEVGNPVRENPVVSSIEVQVPSEDRDSYSPGETTIIRRQLIDAGLWRVSPNDKGYIDNSITDSAEYVQPRDRYDQLSSVYTPTVSPPLSSDNINQLQSYQTDRPQNIVVEAQIISNPADHHDHQTLPNVYPPPSVTPTDLEQNMRNIQDDTKRDRVICTVNPLSEDTLPSSSNQTLYKDEISVQGSTLPVRSDDDSLNQSQTIDMSDVTQTDQSMLDSDVEDEDQCTYL